MRPFTTLLCAGSLGVVLFPVVALGQGHIYGVVSDSSTGKPLVGANVYLVGTALGSSTNLEGTFRITRVPAGEYVLRVSYIGYKTKNIPLQVRPGQLLRHDVALALDVLQGQAVVVTAQAVGQAAAINRQLTANTIMNVVSEEKIQEVPDANAAESVGRLPGVSVRRSGGEANKIVLRGLSDKFSAFMVDGVRIAPTDADARGVDLSTISQGSLAGIELYKAITADQDGDAIAGSVNFVTRRAPSSRLMRVDGRGAHNRLSGTYDQYDWVLRYGQRFFGDVLGVQVSANAEKKDRSKENLDLDYELRAIASGTDYEITDFTLNFTDETRYRQGLSVLLDVDTPDRGSIRLNNIFNRTKRNFIEYRRNYPTTGEELFYAARDREQEIGTYTGSLVGDNHLFGFSANWGLSYANSKSEFPFDYEIDFTEPSTTDPQGNPLSHMRPVPTSVLHGPPELIIPYALNNFKMAYLYTAYFRGEENHDTERTGFLNISREYTLGSHLSGEIKLGGKYRDRARDRSRSEVFSPYYNEAFAEYVDSAGTIVRKNFAGTRFASLEKAGNMILMTNFLDPVPAQRKLFGKYALYPLFNRDAVRLWWELNRDGYQDPAGRNPEYERNLEPDALYYDITERVSAAYLMNTLRFGQRVTVVAGVRVEHENNDYLSRYSKGTLSGFPVPTGAIRDTTASHQETVWLPNFHATVRPVSFANVRLAAYKALARPDFNYRLPNVVLKARSTFFPGNNLHVGNPHLKAAKAWNFEVNTSFFGNKIGLLSISAFYKKVEDMFHFMNGLPMVGQSALDSLGIGVKNPFGVNEFVLYFPYNSTKPTVVKGIELEHQANLRFLPGLLGNIVLSYNLSVVRSETFIPSTRVETYEVVVPPLPFPVKKTRYVLEERKQKLEGQPQLFGNFAIGYDIGGFSGRLSVFHQGRFNRTFSVDGRSDVVQNAYTRWDLALKQQITHNLAFMFNLNNLSNLHEGTSVLNRIQGWDLLSTDEIYGWTADVGVRINL
ncbi:MAG: TonB-dependent receptor [candidate division KSB1 bacterium]|nr:TonB-dependent receptor [candidate division KSB1 bacterium]MDZ7386189.1 TonB-dependent receptor [candidate division KSB1 bacterium]MDZ7392418.1 TonB-dependent receptor [candidate division KSB1 bacterium]MDZ7412263.1 TonB-dependent receptor [candidate division KSB1 bacterium]